MPDMLVKLYELADDWGFLAEQAEQGILIRKPIGSEKSIAVDWVREHFSNIWADETDIAINRTPMSCFLAVKDRELIGFGCYDATGLGFFGPIGVHPDCRNRGTGAALLMACLLDMKLKGYGYAIIGSTEQFDFYAKVAGAVEIPGSAASIWKTWLHKEDH